MENINLFGVPLSEADQLDFGKDKEEESNTEKNKRSKLARDLITAMQQIDTDNITQDFEAPKQWIHFDPYQDTNQGLGKQSKIDM